MSTKRTPLRRNWHREEPLMVTEQMVRLWRVGGAIRNKDSAAFKAAADELQGLCGLSKFAASVLAGHRHLVAGLEHTDELAERWRAALEKADREAGGE